MTVRLDGVQGVLNAMLAYWRSGKRWARYTLDDGNGNKCIVGAVLSVRATASGGAWSPSEEIKAAQHFIDLAVRERGGFGGTTGIMTFNDAQWSYGEIAAVIKRAKELAAASYYRKVQRLPAPPVVPLIEMTPEPVRATPEILPPLPRPALLPPHGSSRLFNGASRVPVNAWAMKD